VRTWRFAVLAGILLIAALILIFLPAIPQVAAYHNFADQRALLGIPNCLNVISNFPFLLVGVWGLLVLMRRRKSGGADFVDPRERWPFLIFFADVALTASGSSYYHLHPANGSLVWVRLPMTVGFTALVAAVIAERISVKAGVRLLAPLLLAGVFSVFYWNLTESAGRGDLRPYAFVQFGSLLTIFLLIALCPARYTRGADFVIALGIYAVAKAFEAADRQIFSIGAVVSGHTLKHLAAAASAYWLLRMLRLRTQISRAIT